jgi:hypothetical protein
VFAPEAVRVVERRVRVGRRTGDGPVLRVSSTRPVVNVALPTARQGSLDERNELRLLVVGYRFHAG